MPISQHAPGFSPVRGRARTRHSRKARILIGVVLVGAAAACADSSVPYFDAPTGIPNSSTGIQNAVTGVFSGMRTDSYLYAYLSTGYARDLFYFVTSAPPVLTIPAGLVPLAPGDFTFNDTWDDEYLQIASANAVLTSLTTVSGYSSQQTAAIQGVVQTAKALEFMFLAETRDTLGIPLYSMDGNPSSPPYCNKDVWQYIVSLLDSGFADLNTAGNIPLPVNLPLGFAAVSSQAAPSTVLGSFASLNRALAGKAGLEYAYAYARNTQGTSPTPASPGSPYVPALQRADSALLASALYNPSVIAPPVAGPFTADPYIVYYNFSGASGDKQNGVFTAYYNYNTTWDFQSAVDTLHDLRWINKFAADPNAVQVAAYAGVSSAKNYVPYSSVSAPIPIIRAEELALVRAQIQLALGNYATAIGLINQVHMQAGGYSTPLSIAATYTAVRDSLMAEQRISTVFEMSGDRMIALRMYNLAAVEDTTWQATGPGPDAVVDAANGHPTDYHTTVTPIPVPEYTQRGGSWTLSCP
jgi:starch-binding outer membrane protein, SusD/RagB family